MQLNPEPLVDELRRLAPEILVNGGSFAHHLPRPSEVVSQHRKIVFEGVKKKATRQCLQDLLASAGLPSIEPDRLPTGARDWPSGYMGSVSDKGTKIVAALVECSRWAAVGIDIETKTGWEELCGISGLAGKEESPPNDAPETVVTFSAKEAVFKAMHPVLTRAMDFDEVTVSWNQANALERRGRACCAGRFVDIRCSTTVPSWIVSVALIPP